MGKLLFFFSSLIFLLIYIVTCTLSGMYEINNVCYAIQSSDEKFLFSFDKSRSFTILNNYMVRVYRTEYFRNKSANPHANKYAKRTIIFSKLIYRQNVPCSSDTSLVLYHSFNSESYQIFSIVLYPPNSLDIIDYSEITIRDSREIWNQVIWTQELNTMISVSIISEETFHQRQLYSEEYHVTVSDYFAPRQVTQARMPSFGNLKMCIMKGKDVFHFEIFFKERTSYRYEYSKFIHFDLNDTDELKNRTYFKTSSTFQIYLCSKSTNASRKLLINVEQNIETNRSLIVYLIDEYGQKSSKLIVKSQDMILNKTRLHAKDTFYIRGINIRYFHKGYLPIKYTYSPFDIIPWKHDLKSCKNINQDWLSIEMVEYNDLLFIKNVYKINFLPDSNSSYLRIGYMRDIKGCSSRKVRKALEYYRKSLNSPH